MNSTTITPGDVTKWMEKGTFGSQTPEDLEPGVETHVSCMLKGDAKAGLAATENSTEVEADLAMGVEATKKLKKHSKSDSLHQIFKDNGLDQGAQVQAEGATDFVAEDVVGDWETSLPVLRCGQCFGQI